MTGSFEQSFLSGVSRALEQGAPADVVLPDPSSSRIVADDAGKVDLFVRRAEEAGMKVMRAASPEEVRNRVIRTAQALRAKSVLLAGPPTPADELLRKEFPMAGIEMLDANDGESAFEADFSVTGVHAAVAETGSLVICAGPGVPRLATLAVPVHVAVVRTSQILADLVDWTRWTESMPPSTGQVLISGPSKTADIELNLVTGVHGPGEVYVVLATDG